jgi:trimeric autotransporter adhesin
MASPVKPIEQEKNKNTMKKIIFLVLFTVVGWQQLQAQCPDTSIAFKWGAGLTYTYQYDGVRNGKCAYKQITPGTTIEWNGTQWCIYGNNQYTGTVFWHSTVDLGDRPSNNIEDWVSDMSILMISFSGTGTIDHASLVEPTASAQTFCNSATVADLVASGASGSTFNWYELGTGGSALISSTALSTGTYYVSQTLSGMESARTSVEVTVNTTPSPTSSAQTFCAGATIANLAANGTNLNWYDVAINGTALTSSTVLATGTYYASQTLNSCESPRTSVQVIVNATTAPTSPAQIYCGSKTIADLTATGTNLKWYDVAANGIALTTSTAVSTGTYYVSQTLNGCEGNRTSVSITINITAPPIAASQTFCSGAKVANLVASHPVTPRLQVPNAFKWYSDIIGGNALATTTVLASGTYYVSRTVGICESVRTPVAVTINTTAAPTASAQTFCGSKTVTDLVAVGTNLKWYNVATNGTALATTTALATGTYYVSQTLNSCESERIATTITLNPQVTPIFNQIPFICYGASLSSLPTTSLEGITGNWSPAINNLATTTYTFTPNPGQCATTAVMTITVNHTTAPNSVGQSLCIGATVASLVANGTDIKWYSTSTGGTALLSETILDNGNYYASQTLNGCESNRIGVTVILNPLLKPTFKQVPPICSGTSLATLPLTSLNGIAGTWSPPINNLATTTYTFTPNAGQCGKTATMKIIVQAPGTTGTIVGGNVTVCAPGTALNSNGVSTVFTNSTTLTLNGNSSGSVVEWQNSFNFENASNANPAWSTSADSSTTNNSVVINGNTLTVSNLTNTVWYRAKVTYGSCVTYTNITKITVSPFARAGVVSSFSSVCSGQSITFTSAAYTGSSIGWEVSTTSATAGFSTVAGENGLNFTMNNAPSSTFYVRTLVTSGDCSIARSAVKTITVNPMSVAGTITGGGTVCSGANKSLKISGCAGAIQWMYSTDGTNFMNVPTGSAIAPTFATTSTSSSASSYVVNNITGTTFFKAVVRSGACLTVETNVVKYSVATSATAGTATAAVSSVCPGTGTTIALVGFAGEITWQKSTNPTAVNPTWTTIATAVSPTLATGNLTVKTAYRANINIGTCAPVVSSNVVLVSINCTTGSKQIDAPTEIDQSFSAVAYPNPSNNIFNFKINGANDDLVSILVFDMTGRQIENKVIKATDVENLILGQKYSSGVYNVIISQGMNTKTLRLVKK